MDFLAVVDAPISKQDHIEAVLDGLNEEYTSFITIVISRSDLFSIDELEVLLMAKKGLKERFNKRNLGPVQANMAQTRVIKKCKSKKLTLCKKTK